MFLFFAWISLANALVNPNLKELIASPYPRSSNEACPGHCESKWTYYGETDACYKTFFGANYYDAEDICEIVGGHLTSIHSYKENVFVAELARMGMPWNTGSELTWIGLTSEGTQSRNWTWTDGTKVDFIAWSQNSPVSGRNCVLIHDGVDYEVGNRKRFMVVVRMECLLTLCSMFIYSQLMTYYDLEENELQKHERRMVLRDRGRASKVLIVFLFLSQAVYFLYFASDTIQFLFFDICALCSGIWTNLLGMVAGFFLINCALYVLDRIPAAKPLLDRLYSLAYIGRILTDRKHQIRVALVTTAVMSALMWFSSDKIIVKEITIPVKNFSGADGGVRIALVSDVHTGASVHKSQVEKMVTTLFDLDVDAVALVGDLVDGPVEQLGDRITPLWRLTHRFTTYFVTGNHEYYYGDAKKWLDLYRDHRIRVLDNQCEMFHRICVVGVNDISSETSGIADHHMNLTVAMSNCSAGSTRVVLAHNPASVLEFSQSDLEKVDVVLSGHTHAAQYYVLVPLISQVLPYFHGLYDLPHGNGKLFVSAGTLYQGAPMKMLRMSEIWVVNIVAAR